MTMKQIRMEPVCDRDFPQRSRQHGYILIAPWTIWTGLMQWSGKIIAKKLPRQISSNYPTQLSVFG